jgi:hypothetical protein
MGYRIQGARDDWTYSECPDTMEGTLFTHGLMMIYLEY